MKREDVFELLNDIFRDVFDDESLTIDDETVSSDIDGWDSLEYINIINAVQEGFQIKLPMNKVIGLQKVGDLVNLIVELKK